MIRQENSDKYSSFNVHFANKNKWISALYLPSVIESTGSHCAVHSRLYARLPRHINPTNTWSITDLRANKVPERGRNKWAHHVPCPAGSPAPHGSSCSSWSGSLTRGDAQQQQQQQQVSGHRLTERGQHTGSCCRRRRRRGEIHGGDQLELRLCLHIVTEVSQQSHLHSHILPDAQPNSHTWSNVSNKQVNFC